MPELPEVETLRADLEREVVGSKITGVQIGLPAAVEGVSPVVFRRRLTGARITGIGRRGKVLLIGLTGGYTIMVHLKMSGQLLSVDTDDPIQKWTRVIFNLSDGNQLRFRDQRKFGWIRLRRTDELARDPFLAGLGPEPLSPGFTVDVLRRAVKRRPRARIKALLLDQTFVAGIGNIYADEILHYARTRPTRRAGGLGRRETAALFEGIRAILAAAIAGRGSSFSQFVDLAGKQGEFVAYHQAYHREGLPCLRNDGGVIKRIKVAGRSTFYCPVCQR